MMPELQSLLPRDEAVGRNLISIDNYKDKSDTSSLKSCPAFRMQRAENKGNNACGNKPKYASSSSLFDIRGYLLQPESRKHKDPPDKTLKENVKALIESEWKRRTMRKSYEFNALQTLARKQQMEEISIREVEQNILRRIGLDSLLGVRTIEASRTNGTANADERKYPKSKGTYRASTKSKQQICDSASLSSKSCTVFHEKRVPQDISQDSSVKTSKSVQDDVLEAAHVTDTPALGVHELRRRYMVRTRTTRTSGKNDEMGSSKLTQTSFTDARSSRTRITLNNVDFRKHDLLEMTEIMKPSWNAGTNQKEGLVQGKERPKRSQTARQKTTSTIDSDISHDTKLSCEEVKSSLESDLKCPHHFTDVSQIFSNNIIPAPPEFDTQPLVSCPHEADFTSPNIYSCEVDYDLTGVCQFRLDSIEKLESEPNSRPPTATGEASRSQEFGAVNKTKKLRPASAKVSSRTTRNRCTQTVEGSRARRRRRRLRRRVIYSPSDVSGPSDRSEDRWSVASDRGADRGRRLGRRKGRGDGRRAMRTSPGRESPSLKTADPRPISGKLSQPAGSRPVSGRSQPGAEGMSKPPPLEEGHRKARGRRRGVTVKRRRSKRKMLWAPRNMPEAIARFLEQLSRDREAIKTIHKMSLVK